MKKIIPFKSAVTPDSAIAETELSTCSHFDALMKSKMQCGRNKLLGAVVTLFAGLAIFYFVSVFQWDGKQNEAGLGADSGSADSSSLRGNGTENESINNVPIEIEPETIEEEDEVEEDGALFVTDKDEFTAAPTGNATDIWYPQWVWNDLPRFIQNAAAVLGYDAKTWNQDLEVATTGKRWDELTLKEKNAARAIGYNKWEWNNHVFIKEKATIVPTGTTSAFSFYYASYMWRDLPEDVRSAAEYLGYTKSTWDEGVFLPLLNTKWGKLTDAQRTAAQEIGYDEATWNDETR